jgi:hypothetical protein
MVFTRFSWNVLSVENLTSKTVPHNKHKDLKEFSGIVYYVGYYSSDFIRVIIMNV